MGKGSSSSYVTSAAQAAAAQSYAPAQAEAVTPAVAKSIAQDTEGAQARQLAARQRLRGVSSTYLRGTDLAGAAAGGTEKLGQ